MLATWVKSHSILLLVQSHDANSNHEKYYYVMVGYGTE